MINYHYAWLTAKIAARPTLVCLHGFSGDLTTFNFLSQQTKFNVLAIDLIGHGQTKSLVHPGHYRMEKIIEELDLVVTKLNLTQFFLLGYSMGGRVALAYSLTYPTKVQGLILESSTPGLKTLAQRQERQRADQHLATTLWQKPLSEFVDYWQAIPLFASQKQLPKAIQHQLRQTRLAQNKYGLALALRYFGTGSQPNYWPKLLELKMPILYIAGQLDQKFYRIGQEFCQRLPAKQVDFKVCVNAGHCIHLEQPVWSLKQILAWIDKQENN